MLLKFLNLGSGFPVKNRLKPFFPFIVRQPENTREASVLSAARPSYFIQLVVNSKENWKYFMSNPTINFALLDGIYLSKYRLFIGDSIVRISEWMSCGFSKRIAFPVLLACVWLWRVVVFVRSIDGSVPSLRCGLISSIRHQATPRVEAPVFHILTVSTHICRV